jgi:hypothetical protein
VFRFKELSPSSLSALLFLHILFVIYLMKSLSEVRKKSLPSEVIICPSGSNRPKVVCQNAPFKTLPVQIDSIK